ncbi:hypothetical protein [Clostridium aminobutyricum]|uniref:Uncharacterized protein n=1 Tax=Clostridium aminobutyricum TaxID=33953 RepID=A0A939D823_CLOAM|nr:hypothetical protein [Clostridium aminobutyricum]MBN7772508.1 hypothetical protein [Clostridium aminobutyricum]
MSISDIKVRSNRKTVFVYIIASIVALVVNSVYGIFSHGVSSGAMTWMFLYPLLGGAFFYVVMGVLIPTANRINGYRKFYNLYNSGIATLTVGSFLNGILEIAGTSSPYTIFFYFAGGLLMAVGSIAFSFKLLMAVSTKEIK